MIYSNGLGQRGRIGNQMFQYAALVGIAKNNGYDFRIPDHRKNKYLVQDLFPGKIVYTYHELNKLFEMNHLTEHRFGYGDVIGLVLDESVGFDEKFFNSCPDEVTLEGYFESYKYFENVETELRKDFVIKENILKAARNFHSNTWYPVCISVRRGDFLKYADRHMPCEIEYYNECIDILGRDRQYVVTSDDIEWCKQNFIGDNFIFQDTTIEGMQKSHLDFAIASLCEDFIIANSTFSWWIAWMGTKKGKRILAPDPWFGPERSHYNTDGFYPPGVERISR